MSIKKMAARKFAKEVSKRGGKQATKQVTKRVGRKVAKKAATKLAVKAGAKTIPVAGEVLMALDAAPAVQEMAWTQAKIAGKTAADTWGQLREGKYKEAAKTAGQGLGTYYKEVPKGFGRVVKAALIGHEPLLSSDEMQQEVVSVQQNPRRKANMAKRMRRNPGSGAQIALYPADNKRDFDQLLSLLITLRTTYLYMHWNARTYSEHLQYERLYQTLDEDIDTLAELAVKQVGRVYPTAVNMPTSLDDVKETEVYIQELAASMIEKTKYKVVNFMALENFLMNLIQNRQRVLYLLDLE